jgi:plastocyanin
MVVLALGATSAFADQSFSVELRDFSFAPNAFTVKAGEKVTFQARNAGQRPHNIEIEGPGGFKWLLVSSGNVAPGASATGDATFTTPGTYEFYCPVGNHRAQGMVATFTVTAASGAAAAPAAAAPAAALPRTGEPAMLLGGALAAAGAFLSAGGIFLRRRD